MKTTPEAKAEELLAKHGPLLAMDVARGRLWAHEAEVRRDPCPAAGRTLAFWAAVVGELRRRRRNGGAVASGWLLPPLVAPRAPPPGGRQS